MSSAELAGILSRLLKDYPVPEDVAAAFHRMIGILRMMESK